MPRITLSELVNSWKSPLFLVLETLTFPPIIPTILVRSTKNNSAVQK